MTAQASDLLLFEGDEYQLYTEPLEAYFKQNSPRPRIESPCTACWRGYVGTWQIKRSKLYLVKTESFDGGLLDLKSKTFPKEKGPVFASWFTGSLVCPNGREVEYVHMGYETKYEKYLIIEIVDGMVSEVLDLSLDEYREWLRGRSSRP